MDNPKKVSELKNTRKERRVKFYEGVKNQTYNLSDAVREYRYMLDKTQQEFAEFSKVPLRTIRDFEQGRGNPTISTLIKLLKGSGLELSVRMAATPPKK